ncbi:hypothetical protein CI610_02319 [invertebrate metagenome]|uniref:Uncharacterized protein n=1 Tax=invertebrate metagenome TaxID=1711999 RepID=A0A2H9T6A1_9ZZZZ
MGISNAIQNQQKRWVIKLIQQIIQIRFPSHFGSSNLSYNALMGTLYFGIQPAAFNKMHSNSTVTGTVYQSTDAFVGSPFLDHHLQNPLRGMVKQALHCMQAKHSIITHGLPFLWIPAVPAPE